MNAHIFREIARELDWRVCGQIAGVLVDLHHKPEIKTSPDLNGVGNCGKININAVQQVIAAKWAVDVINNQSKPQDLKIGKEIFSLHLYFYGMQRHLVLGKSNSFFLMPF